MAEFFTSFSRKPTFIYACAWKCAKKNSPEILFHRKIWHKLDDSACARATGMTPYRAWRINERTSIGSQGYDTFVAESNEKLWKQKSDQFMKRNKSESNRDRFLSLSLSLFTSRWRPFCLPLLRTPEVASRRFVFLISPFVPQTDWTMEMTTVNAATLSFEL